MSNRMKISGSVWRGVKAALLVGLAVAGCAEEPTPVGVDCGAHPSCGLDGPACSGGQECLSIRGCLSAICIATEQACVETCGVPSCIILESFPAQLACEGREPVPGIPSGQTCDELEQERAAELDSIQSCSTSSECGRDLQGTSCGCTRNLVARTNADITRFSEIQSALSAAQCGGLVTTCDCPAADGFACIQGRCTWSYVDAPATVDP